jgi:hypothetical protein|tara:strand:- start:375 stop:905 length:531 start_codon:yes stop_codon:yes gene_type:complete
MKIEIKIEDGIKKSNTKTGMLDDKAKKLLRDMKVGQSFVVETASQKQAVQIYGNKVGLKFSSRKIYTGTNKGSRSPHVYRIWKDGTTSPKTIDRTKEYARNRVKNFGSLTKTDVSDGDGQATTRHKVSNEVLAMAELRADNKRIVEDLDKIKQILKEELGHDLEKFRPLNEDAPND